MNEWAICALSANACGGESEDRDRRDGKGDKRDD